MGRSLARVQHDTGDVADGADVAQGTTTDAAWSGSGAGTVVAVLKKIASGGTSGGPATIADGADVAQGTTTDTASASTVIGLLKAVKAAVQGTLQVAGTLGRSWTLSSGTDSVNVGNFPGTQSVSGTVTANAGTNLNTSALALETGGNLATIAAKDFATQTTLALIKAKTDNLDVALSTRTDGVSLAKDATLTAALGSVTDSPGAYTVLDQLARIRKTEEANGKILQALLAAATPVAPRKTPPTLLHRS